MLTTKSLFAACAASALISFTGSAQEAGLQWTNLGELRAPTSGEHVLTGKAAAVYQLEQVRAELAPYAYQEPVDFAGSRGLEQTNVGEPRAFVFEGHQLSKGAEGGPPSILYAPSEADDANYRAAIAAATGATVDYFDARAATPSVATLSQYDAVHTWANFAYADNVTFGNNLAAYNDAGGTVVLGVFCTYTTGNFLSGAIMTAAYCPVVSPLGNNHFSSSGYVGDGTTCIYTGVSTLVCTFRDFLVTQGSGAVDGTYADAEICHAYRTNDGPGQGRVIYSNGSGAFQLSGTGQWGAAVGNSCTCTDVQAILYAPSEADDPAYRAAISAAAGGATVDYFDARAATPSGALLSNYGGVHVWANFAFFDNVAYGNNLATFVDNGGSVVMGAFCTYTSGNFLSGQIMTPAYSPVVSPFGNNHFSNDTDTGPWFTCLNSGVTSLTAFYRDFLVTQGSGIIDGKFNNDKEIATAFRLNPGGGVGEVVYANGSGGAPVAGTGEWPQVIANSVTCGVGTQGPPASCVVRLGVLGLNPTDASCGNNPVVGQVWNVQISTVPTIGTSTTATVAALGLGGPTSGLVVFGFELLILPPFLLTSGLGSHNIPIPATADFIGATFTLQGARAEAGPAVVVLTNALDVTVGI